MWRTRLAVVSGVVWGVLFLVLIEMGADGELNEPTYRALIMFSVVLFTMFLYTALSIGLTERARASYKWVISILSVVFELALVVLAISIWRYSP